MGTRSNLYKNPSIAYKKDLSLSSVLQNLKSYNIVTGNAPLIEQPPPSKDQIFRHKRRRSPEQREVDPTGRRRSLESEQYDVAVSHQDYINQRRKEVSSSKPYEELTADVLQGASSSNVNLVDYESDESASLEPEEKNNHPDSGDANDLDQVKSRSEQRFPHPGEPVCVVCGKYGEYICNETNDDICSLECKAVLVESIKQPERPMSNNANQDVCSSAIKCAMPVPEFGENTWEHDHHRWSKTRSTLCTYECWKCRKPGHLAEDCLVISTDEVDLKRSKSNSISKDLLAVYRRCHQIGKNLSNANCDTCRISISLATCLACSGVFCDSAGHLNEHIGLHPSHQRYYSHKLKRLVKCCKSTCEMTDIKSLLACHYCFDKAFEKFYDMYTATWKIAGLSMIWGSIGCEDHFDWHRMNCLSADIEGNAYIVARNIPKGKRVELSDFIF